MEKNVFTAPAVAEVLTGMIEARLHTDGGDASSARNKALQLELTNSVATPIYVVQDATTGAYLIGEMKASYMRDEGSFAALLSNSSADLAAGGGKRPKVASK